MNNAYGWFYQEGYAGDLDTLKATGRKYIYSE